MKLYTCANELKKSFPLLYGNVKLEQIKRYNKLIRHFRATFGQKSCYVASAGGRVELVGNHTDHNGGKVLGATVSIDIAAAFLPRDDGKVVVSSDGYTDLVFTVDEIGQKEATSAGLIKGVMARLVELGYKIGGFSAYTHSTVPVGAGVSSSAAFELLVGQIQNHLYNDGAIDAVTLAKVGQYAENVYFEKPCGLLDQGVIAVGNVVEMDFANGFEYEQLASHMGGLSLVLINSGSHSKLTSEYAAIPTEMKAVAQYFGKERLCEVDEDEFFAKINDVTEKVGLRPSLRATHFFEENKRVENAAAALKAGDLTRFLTALNQSGESSATKLQNVTYEGSDGKLAEVISTAKKHNASGAVRVHGGGFAGSALCVVRNENRKKFVDDMQRIYGKANVTVVRVRSVGACVL